MTKIVQQNELEKIVDAVKEGKLVAFPTETVYGVGIEFKNLDALERLMEAKNRDYSKAITLMVSKKEEIEKYAYVSDDTRKIINAFMPGMITLVFNKKECVNDLMTHGKKTIGIRIPDSQFVLELLEKAGPMLVTSANLSNHPNTTTTKEVLEQLDGRIDMVVDGVANSTTASTVVDVTGDEIKILREGIITLKDIEEVLK